VSEQVFPHCIIQDIFFGDYGIEGIPFGYKRMNPQEIESVEIEAKLIEQCLV